MNVLIGENMRLNLDEEYLSIEFEWYEQFWAIRFTNVMKIPIAHIQTATPLKPIASWRRIRYFGTVFGSFLAGTWFSKEGKEFWYVTEDRSYLTLELQLEPYCRVILTTPDHQIWCDRINQQSRRVS